MLRYIVLALLIITNANAQKPLQEYNEFDSFINTHNNKYIIINRGSQQLLVIDEGEVELEMKVIVGKRGWSTPVKETSIVNVITNPSWHVPRSISGEVRRKIARDPEKARRQGYVMSTDANGVTKYTQLAGPANVLGKVKYKLSNIGNIYMHDTSGKYLFKKEKRKLSHGCIRLEKPMELLENISDINYKKSKYPQWHKIDPVPVYIVDWGREDG